VIVFVVPTLSTTMDKAAIAKNTLAVLYVVGACFGLIQMVTMMSAADAAADHLDQLQQKLSAEIPPESNAQQPLSRFDVIEMRQATFRYPGTPSEPGFHIGPLDFRLARGDLVFISGGNGS